MRSLSTAVLSLIAMALSSMTTYLTFFDARYTLTVAVADAPLQIQTSSSRNNGVTTANYQFYPKPSIILSNRGTRALVLHTVELYRSNSLTACDIDGQEAEGVAFGFEPKIVEPGSVQQLVPEFGLDRLSGESASGQRLVMEPDEALFCIKWVVFDPNGNRREPVSPAFSWTLDFSTYEEGDLYPRADVKIDYPKEPTRLVARGFF